MPSGKIWLDIVNDTNSPTVVKLLGKIKSSGKLSFNALFSEEEKRKWRADGINSYQVQVFSVERLPETTSKGKEFLFKCQMIGMNARVNKFPYGFSYPESFRENYCEIYLNTKGEMRFGYNEYLTL